MGPGQHEGAGGRVVLTGSAAAAIAPTSTAAPGMENGAVGRGARDEEPLDQQRYPFGPEAVGSRMADAREEARAAAAREEAVIGEAARLRGELERLREGGGAAVRAAEAAREEALSRAAAAELAAAMAASEEAAATTQAAVSAQRASALQLELDTLRSTAAEEAQAAASAATAELQRELETLRAAAATDKLAAAMDSAAAAQRMSSLQNELDALRMAAREGVEEAAATPQPDTTNALEPKHWLAPLRSTAAEEAEAEGARKSVAVATPPAWTSRKSSC